MSDKCKHRWGSLLIEYRKRVFPAEAAKVCIKCGLLKSPDLQVGSATIRISRHRIDMGGRPIRNVSRIDISTRLRIPVGTNMFD